MKILVLTVGGSSEPLVSSIKQNKPERNTPYKIAFICSDESRTAKGSYTQVNGQGLVCDQNSKPNILVQANLASADYQIVKIKEPDDPNECYLESLRLLRQLRREQPEAQIIADYTGGTKSMSVGLAMAATDVENVVVAVQQGLRKDLNKVVSGTQFTHITRQLSTVINRQHKLVAFFFYQFNYTAGISLLEDLLSLPDLSSSLAKPLQQQLALARALDAWDRFDHGRAWGLLSPLRSEYVELVKFLEATTWSRRRLEPEFDQTMSAKMTEQAKGHGYELVQDLLLNSERRATQGRYDDAVARLYRALELLAQARLKYGYQIDTGDLQIKLLPVSLKLRYEQKRKEADKRIQLGLRDAYELLNDLSEQGEEPLGQLYSKYRQRLVNFLSIRNQSLLAHGTTPVTEAEYSQARAVISDFCTQAIESLLAVKDAFKPYAKPVQFPQSVPDILLESYQQAG